MEHGPPAALDTTSADIRNDLLPPIPHLLWNPLRAAVWGMTAAVGGLTILVGLAVLAAIPLANFLALGYLLEAEGRVARSGRIRDGFPLIHLAPRLGVIVLGVWLWVLPLRLLSSMTADAMLLQESGRAAANLKLLTLLCATLTAGHLILALFRGGRVGCFLRPIKNLRYFLAHLRSPELWRRRNAAVARALAELRPRYYFSLGARGFAGALLWLVIPTALFAAARRTEGSPVVISIFGGAMLALVLSWLPFLQARFATGNRLRAMFDVSAVRELYRRRPVLWLLSILLIYALSLPLYLFKIIAPPRDAVWLITLVFIASIFPARLWTGWVYHRAVYRERRANLFLRITCRLLIAPLLTLYVFLLFFTQFLGAHGKGVLFEHHAFLLPVPF